MYRPSLQEIQLAKRELEKFAADRSIPVHNAAFLPLMRWLEVVTTNGDEAEGEGSGLIEALARNPSTGSGLRLGILTSRGRALVTTLLKVSRHITLSGYELPTAIAVLTTWSEILSAKSSIPA